MLTKMPRVTAVQVVAPYSLDITFNDGTKAIINLDNELYGEVFEPLHDPSYFAQVHIEGHTVAWPNGADFSPEWLYQQAMAKVQ